MKRALITGVSGQDGYEVFGVVRNYSDELKRNLKFLGLEKKVSVIEADLFQFREVRKIIEDIKPDEMEIQSLAVQ